MAEPSLLYTKGDGIARLTFNRPDVRIGSSPSPASANAHYTLKRISMTSPSMTS